MIAGQQRQNESQLRQYLLGQAGEEEQRIIEQSLLANQEYFDQLLRCEEELIDEYAGGAMKGADKECFEKHFMAGPERRESVAFAQALHRYFVSQKRSRAGMWELSPGGVARMNIAMMVAAIVLAVASAMLLRTTVQLRQLVEQNQAELARAEQRKKMLTEQVARLTDLVQELSKGVPSAHKDDSDLASLILAPGLNRSGDPSATLNLSPNIHRLRLILKLEGESYHGYQAEIQNTEGEIVWKNDGLRGRQTGSQRTIELIVPTRLITRSDYLVILSGASTSGSFDKIGTYHFNVIRK
jgi:cell division protein FtsB